MELELLTREARIRDLEARLFVCEAQLQRAWDKDRQVQTVPPRKAEWCDCVCHDGMGSHTERECACLVQP